MMENMNHHHNSSKRGGRSRQIVRRNTAGHMATAMIMDMSAIIPIKITKKKQRTKTKWRPFSQQQQYAGLLKVWVT